MISNIDNNAEEDNVESALGFMFDSLHSKTWKVFELPKQIQIKIQLIDENPGHVQSGLYLWPAAEYACHYLASVWGNQFTPKSIIELGAGCGLSSIYASKLGGLCIAILTDYDLGCIDLLRNNVRANTNLLVDKKEKSSSALSTSSFHLPSPCEQQLELTNQQQSSNCKLFCEVFKWGSEVTPLLQLLKQEGGMSVFDMILGTDLLYCVDVVNPLLRSVSQLLGNKNSVFVLVSSFDIGEVR
jgi:predicted nicotinamide N-methyase